MSALREQNAQLQQMLRELLLKQDEIADQQSAVLGQFQQALDRGLRAPAAPAHADAAPTQVGRPPLTPGYEEEDEEVPVFVPSRIRTGRGKLTGSGGVQSESSETSSNFDNAAARLAALRKAASSDES